MYEIYTKGNQASEDIDFNEGKECTDDYPWSSKISDSRPLSLAQGHFLMLNSIEHEFYHAHKC